MDDMWWTMLGTLDVLLGITLIVWRLMGLI